MFLGHYATALVPYEKTRRGASPAPFWLLLVAAQFLDLVMLAFVMLGIEKFEPETFVDASFVTMQTDMLYTHDIVPVLGWTLVFGLVVFAVTRVQATALWCAGLVAFHEVLDLAVGFEHAVMGHGTTVVGLNLYHRAPVVGLLLEAALCGGIIWWFARQREKAGTPISARLKWSLYALLVGGTLATLPMATQSLRALLAG